MELDISFDEKVSIHSRTEAAAYDRLNVAPHCYCFNTQPREGGCKRKSTAFTGKKKFQHTAARRRLRRYVWCCCRFNEFQHTAAWRRLLAKDILKGSSINVSTHSRAEAAAEKAQQSIARIEVSTHSRAKAAAGAWEPSALFQHTAARRRLRVEPVRRKS